MKKKSKTCIDLNKQVLSKAKGKCHQLTLQANKYVCEKEIA